MSLSKELGDASGRFREYIDRLVSLLKQHSIDSIPKLIAAFRNNPDFSNEWRAIWSEIAQADGGKLSLTTVGAILGAVLGGVGIAAAGGAIGLPLALILGLGGLLAGTEFDAFRSQSKSKTRVIRLPSDLYERIKIIAEKEDIAINALIVEALNTSFPDRDDLGVDV